MEHESFEISLNVFMSGWLNGFAKNIYIKADTTEASVTKGCSGSDEC